ncbi:MAG: hypothetical protein ACPGU1_08520 [Myxococcota bacterium]
MSDTDNPTDDQSTAGEQAGTDTDAADLKARLGLRTRKRRVGRPTSASLGGGGDVAEARQRAEDASAEAGTPEEAFSAFESDKTPLPQVLPGSEVGGVADDAPSGSGKLATKPMIVTLLVVAGVSMLLGQVLGGSLEQQGLWDTHASYTKDRLKAMSTAKTKTGAELIPALTAYQAALKATTKELEAAKLKKVGGEEERAKVLKAFMETTKAFANDGVYFNPKALMDDILVLYKDDELLASVSFAMKTRHLHDLATSLVEESKAYNRMAKGPLVDAIKKSGGKAGASRTVLVSRSERDVPKLGKIPTSTGSWVLDTGKPQKVKVTEKGRSSSSEERWEIMVVEVGKTAEQAVQVPTSDVMTLDMMAVYEEHAELVQRRKNDRVEAMVVSLKAVSDTIRWSDLEKQLKEHAAEAE